LRSYVAAVSLVVDRPFFFFFQAEDGIRDFHVTGVQTCALPIYLADREREASFLAECARNAGVSTVQPAGLHGIYLNAGRLLPHLGPEQFPGHALACALYREGGIRCSELGSLYLGELNEHNQLVKPAPFELVRLALPRRVYDHSHWEYVGEVLAEIAKDPEQVPGYRITHAPKVLRHFRCRTEPVTLRRSDQKSD